MKKITFIILLVILINNSIFCQDKFNFLFVENNKNIEILQENFIFNIIRVGTSALITPRSNMAGNIEVLSENKNFIIEMELDMLNLKQSKTNRIIKPFFLFDHYWNSENKILSNTGRFTYCDNTSFYNKDSTWNQDVVYDLNTNNDLLLLNLPYKNEIHFSEDDKFLAVTDTASIYLFDLEKKQLLKEINITRDHGFYYSQMIAVNTESHGYILIQEKELENYENSVFICRYNFNGNLTESISIDLMIQKVFQSENHVIIAVEKDNHEIENLLIVSKNHLGIEYLSNNNIKLIKTILKKHKATSIQDLDMSTDGRFISISIPDLKNNCTLIAVLDQTNEKIIYKGYPPREFYGWYYLKQDHHLTTLFHRGNLGTSFLDYKLKIWKGNKVTESLNLERYTYPDYGSLVLEHENYENQFSNLIKLDLQTLQSNNSKDSTFSIMDSIESMSPELFSYPDIFPWNKDASGLGNTVIKADSLKNFGVDGVREDRFVFYNSLMKTNSEKYVYLTFYKNLNFIFFTPDHYYYTNEHSNFTSYFTKDLKVYPLEQFDLKYNRPDIILDRLGYADSLTIASYHSAYLKRLKKMNFTEEMLKDDFHLPELKINNFEFLPSITDSSDLNLDFDIKDSKYKLDRINIFINDVPVFGTAGIDLRKEDIQEINKKINLSLSEGENKIQVSVLNQAGAESYKETAYITYKPKKSVQPNLYLITIGDSRYSDSRFDLTYASKDAVDIAEAFSNNKNSLYENVFSFTYTDEKVTRENILLLKEELKKAKRDDVVIISVAGHGVLDDKLDYYLATHDMNFSNPSGKGIPYEELESLLDGIAPLKKVLFLDACHSGEVDKEEVELLAQNNASNGKVKFRNAGAGIQKKNLGLKTTSELMSELFTDLRRGTGATVISSAGGAEYAMESDEWKNGLFTYCLLHGLKDKAADANKDGEIWLSELQSYLRKEVTELSNGAQQPTSRIENLSMDFRVW
jgi:uncharacterized caspase-like protein